MIIAGNWKMNFNKEEAVKLVNEIIKDNNNFKKSEVIIFPPYLMIHQIKEVINTIKTNPDSRRMIVSAWNPSVLPNTQQSFSENVANQKAALPPCHAFFQFYVADGKLSCQLYQRSADLFLGVPFNIASYALLTLMVAQVCHLSPGDFVHTFGDVHIYSNHREQLEEQYSRKPRPLPTMRLNPNINSIFDFTIEDFTLLNYDPHPHIKGKVAI